VVKANSFKWVRTKWSREFAWQTGYGVLLRSVLPASRFRERRWAIGNGARRKRRGLGELLEHLSQCCVSGAFSALASTVAHSMRCAVSPPRIFYFWFSHAGERVVRGFFRPVGAWFGHFYTHGLRRGLHSCAASRLSYTHPGKAASLAKHEGLQLRICVLSRQCRERPELHRSFGPQSAWAFRMTALVGAGSA